MPARALSAEVRFVFRCADPKATAAELLELATHIQDWPRALRMAEREGATAALWRALRESAGVLPKEAAEFLRARTMMSDFRMVQLSQRLSETVAAFRERGVPLMLLKGAAVGAISDASFRERPMTDLDLLVRPADVARARDAVLAAGWHQTEDERLHTLLQGMHHQAPFFDGRLPGLRLELHTALLPPDHSFAISESDFWAAATPASAPFEGASVPSREHMLFHTAVHYAWQHQMNFGTWRTLRSAAVVAQSPGFDWQSALDMAAHTKGLSSLYWTLRLSQRLAAIAIPPTVLARCAPPTAQWLTAAIERTVIAEIAPGEGPTSPSVRLSRLLWRGALRPKWSGLRDAGRKENHSWARTMGTHRDESFTRRMQRHASSSRDWWSFVTETLVGR